MREIEKDNLKGHETTFTLGGRWMHRIIRKGHSVGQGNTRREET